jgi:uncharacterized protein (TIGR02466 family)
MGLQSILPSTIYTYDLKPPKKVSERMISYMDKFTDKSLLKIKDSDLNVTGDCLDHYLIFKDPTFFWLNSQIAYHVKKYLKLLRSKSVSHSIHIQKAWPVVVFPEGGRISTHTHRNSHLSLVYYIKTGYESCSYDTGGELTFKAPYRSPMNLLPLYLQSDSRFSSFGYKIKPLDNRIVIFPSNLEHDVAPYFGENNRYSVSYDIMITTKSNPLESDLEMNTLHPSMWMEIS